MKIVFVGSREFVEIFDAFGFETRTAVSEDEAEKIVGSLGAEYVLICMPRLFSVAARRISELRPELNIVLLSAKFDSKNIIGDFKTISEKAAGVDLTGKLEQ